MVGDCGPRPPAPLPAGPLWVGTRPPPAGSGPRRRPRPPRPTTTACPAGRDVQDHGRTPWGVGAGDLGGRPQTNWSANWLPRPGQGRGDGFYSSLQTTTRFPYHLHPPFPTTTVGGCGSLLSPSLVAYGPCLSPDLAGTHHHCLLDTCGRLWRAWKRGRKGGHARPTGYGPSRAPVAPGSPRPRATHAAPTDGNNWLPWVVGRGRYALAPDPVADG